MVVPMSLDDSELEELYALPDDRSEQKLVVGDVAGNLPFDQNINRHFCILLFL